MAIHLLKFTGYLENALCIYRNYRSFNKIWRALITFRIIVEITSIAFFGIGCAYYNVKHTQYRIDIMYFYLSSINSIIVIAMGRYHSDKYEGLLAHLKLSNKLFGKDFFENMTKNEFIAVGIMFLLICGESIVCLYHQVTYYSSNSIPTVVHVLFEVNLFVCKLRYICEYVVLYCVLKTICKQLQYVTKRMNNSNGIKYNEEELISEVDKCNAIYKNIRESSELYNHVFGVQLATMLATTVVYYLIVIYTMTSRRISGSFSIVELAFFTSTLVLILTIFGFLSQAAQLMENHGQLLKKRLCKLLIISISSPEIYRTTRNLLRMMVLRPVHACAFGVISVNMALIPAAISFLTTHIVVALQFNNTV